MEMTTLVLLLLVPLAVWRIYSRLKVVLGRTKSELWRHYATLAVMVAAGGGGAGVRQLGGAGRAGRRRGGGRTARPAEHEAQPPGNRPEGFFYTQDRKLGLLVVMLFISRLIYRLFEACTCITAPLTDFLGNPISLAVWPAGRLLPVCGC
jgi:hypothetical protein